MISVLILAFNEEKNLPRLFAPLKGVQDIVLLDHESTDKTAELATSLGARVITRPFPFVLTTEDDVTEFKKRFGHDPLFVANEKIYESGKERSDGGKLCENDWILNLDCDEIITWDYQKTLEEIKDCDILNCKYYHDRTPTMERMDWIQTSKLYNKQKIFWIGRTHEVLNGYNLKIKMSDSMEIDHYNRSGEQKRKYINQLEYSVLHDGDLRNIYYLGIEYHHWGYWREAIFMFNIYLKESGFVPEKAKSYLVAAMCFWAIGKEDEAWIYSMLSLKLNPDNPEVFAFISSMATRKHKEIWLKYAQAGMNDHLL